MTSPISDHCQACNGDGVWHQEGTVEHPSPMTPSPKPTNKQGKKNIEVVIREMIEMVLEQGHKPWQILLTEEDYIELAERTDAFYPPGYEIVEDGVIYKPEPVPKGIGEYMGVPVYHGTITRIRWI